MTTEYVKELARKLRSYALTGCNCPMCVRDNDVAAILERLAEDAKAKECATIWSSYGRAGAGMALDNYRKYLMGA